MWRVDSGGPPPLDESETKQTLFWLSGFFFKHPPWMSQNPIC